MNIETLSTRKYKAGYEIRTEYWSHNGDDEKTLMKAAYTPDGEYIGNSKWAHRLVVKRGIRPQKAMPSHSVCSIGFCKKEQKWYGWSHRAIFGFGIGDVVKEGDIHATSGWTDDYLAEHPEEDLSLPVGFRAETLNDAKRMAVAFAESVS